MNLEAHVFVLNDREHGSKFDLKSDEGMLLRYSRNNRDYKVLNKRSKTIMESVNVALDDQGITSIELRKDDAETEGPQFAPGDNDSTNDTTPNSRPNPIAEDASSSSESSP